VLLYPVGTLVPAMAGEENYNMVAIMGQAQFRDWLVIIMAIYNPTVLSNLIDAIIIQW
jgi:hypothetical protein